MTDKCLQANSIPVPVHLATKLKDALRYLASDATIFVQQIHFWQVQGYGVLHEGRRWIYNRYEDWLAQLPWLTDYAFRKIKAVLLGMKIIEAQPIADHGRDRTLHYAINYDHELIKDFLHRNSTHAGDDITAAPDVDSATNNTKTSPKISAKTTNVVVDEDAEIRQVIANAPFAQPAYLHVRAETSVQPSTSNDDHSSEQRQLLQKIRDRVPLTTCLQKAVLQATTEVVQDALSVFDQALSAQRIDKPVAYLLSAIRGSWKPAQLQVSAKQKEFLDAYVRLIATGIVADIDVRYLNLDSFGEPLLRLLPSHRRSEWGDLVPWRRIITLLE